MKDSVNFVAKIKSAKKIGRKTRCVDRELLARIRGLEVRGTQTLIFFVKTFSNKKKKNSFL